MLAIRLAASSQEKASLRAWLLAEHAPAGNSNGLTHVTPLYKFFATPLIGTKAGLTALFHAPFSALASLSKDLPSLALFKARATPLDSSLWGTRAGASFDCSGAALAPHLPGLGIKATGQSAFWVGSEGAKLQQMPYQGQLSAGVLSTAPVIKLQSIPATGRFSSEAAPSMRTPGLVAQQVGLLFTQPVRGPLFNGASVDRAYRSAATSAPFALGGGHVDSVATFMAGDMLAHYLGQYQQKLTQVDYLSDWRALKLEREV